MCVMCLNVNMYPVSHWTYILIANVILVRQSLNDMGDVCNCKMTIISLCWMTV